MTTFFIVLCDVAIVFLLFLSFRNMEVYAFRRRIVEALYKAAVKDVHAGKSLEEIDWRWDKYDEVSYQFMMWTFWKRLKVSNYWADDAFIDYP